MWDFVRAFYSSWGSGVTGTLSAPLFVVAFLTNGVPRIASAAFAVACLFVASYIVWAKERKRAQELEGRPEVSFTIQSVGGALYREWFFWFLNASDATAINVTLSPISAAGLKYEFDPVASLVKGPAATAMGYKGSMGGAPIPSQSGNWDMLFMLSLGSERVPVYDVKLEFSNYGDVSRWQTDYRIECDYDAKTMACIAGACRKLR